MRRSRSTPLISVLNRSGFLGGSDSLEVGAMTRRSKYPKEVRERAVRMVFEHRDEHPSQWAAITSIAMKVGVSSETLRKWDRTAEVDGGQRLGLTTEERERLKVLERENRELRRANEILKSAAAFFGAELDRRPTR
jgi:transposase